MDGICIMYYILYGCICMCYIYAFYSLYVYADTTISFNIKIPFLHYPKFSSIKSAFVIGIFQWWWDK